jgi:hypothetical protein
MSAAEPLCPGEVVGETLIMGQLSWPGGRARTSASGWRAALMIGGGT